MASGGKSEESGRRLAQDMRKIRRSRSISSEAVIRATKAAPTVVEEFEETALVGNPMYNRVYLRLFIRGYAEVIGIRSEDALRSMDEVIEGVYEGTLAKLYLPVEEESAAKEDEGAASREAATEDPAVSAPEPGSGASADSAAKRGSGTLADAAVERGGKTRTTTSPRALQERSEASKPPKAPPRKAAAPKAPPRKAAAAPSRRKPKPAARKAITTILLPGGGQVFQWIFGVLGAIAIVAIAWALWPEDAPEQPRVLLPADTLSSRLPPLPPRLLLADTSSFYVIAARDTLNPIRVTVDRGTRTPYWVELLDSLEFRVADELVIERELEAIDVSVRGVLVPTDHRDAQGRLVLTRDRIQAHFDSLRSVGGLPDA